MNNADSCVEIWGLAKLEITVNIEIFVATDQGNKLVARVLNGTGSTRISRMILFKPEVLSRHELMLIEVQKRSVELMKGLFAFVYGYNMPLIDDSGNTVIKKFMNSERIVCINFADELAGLLKRLFTQIISGKSYSTEIEQIKFAYLAGSK